MQDEFVCMKQNQWGSGYLPCIVFPSLSPNLKHDIRRFLVHKHALDIFA
jgi:hypothetical protein